MNHDGPAIADALSRARHRIERDEALLRQALEALESLFSWQADPDRGQRCSNAIAALRERLGEKT
jgi:hypothetical protein